MDHCTSLVEKCRNSISRTDKSNKLNLTKLERHRPSHVVAALALSRRGSHVRSLSTSSEESTIDESMDITISKGQERSPCSATERKRIKGLSTPGNIVWKQCFPTVSKQFEKQFLGHSVSCPGLSCRQDACLMKNGRRHVTRDLATPNTRLSRQFSDHSPASHSAATKEKSSRYLSSVPMTRMH
ncbi:hypothetical protein E2C01_039959 [Portunus trituberculatus]|uniref:Uncharacterized protein n=1 Tax=Portunus trituberculatus TaxID=210409 RepID=A0A5B7FLE8_PORTR|nr:hypothetical protein [Portunus trituberculatus]